MCTEVPVGSYGNQALNYLRFFCSLTYTVKFQQDKDFVIGYKLSYWWWLLHKWTLWSAVLRGVCWSMIDCRGWSLSRVPRVPAWICHFHLPTLQHAVSCHEVFMGAESAAIPERSSKQGCVTHWLVCRSWLLHRHFASFWCSAEHNRISTYTSESYGYFITYEENYC